MINNFTEIKPLCYWVQHILPLVYDDSLSYMELLARVTKRLNELIENNNKLPGYIIELIKEYISSGEIKKILADVLANYMLNVKFPPAGLTPATGDGTADDTEAIQGCIDYAFNNGGMAVYFPSGSYLVQSLTLRNKSTLFGNDRYTTRLVLKGGATAPLLVGNVNELTLRGLGFDGNMDIQVNNIDLIDLTVNSAIITNLLLTDGYDLLKITVNEDLQLNDIIFNHAVTNAIVSNGNGYVQGCNLIFKTVSTLAGDNFVILNNNHSILEQLKFEGTSPKGITVNGSNNVIKMWTNDNIIKPYVDNGNNNSFSVYTKSESQKLSGFYHETVNSKTENISGAKNVNANSSNETVTTEKELTAATLTENVNVKTVTADSSTENLRTKTETLAEDKTVNARNSHENLTGNKYVRANTLTEELDTKSETVNGNKTVSSQNSTETVTVNKIVNVRGSVTETIGGTLSESNTGHTETIQGDKTLSTGDYTETVTGNKTVKVTEDYKEETDGTKTAIADLYFFDVMNPLKYWLKEPLNRYFDSIKMLDKNGNVYKPLVYKEDMLLSFGYYNALDYNVKNDGTDTTTALKSFIENAETGSILFLPSGNYLVNETITITKPIVLIGTGISTKITFSSGGFIINSNYVNLSNMLLMSQSKTETGIKVSGKFCRLYNLILRDDENGNYFWKTSIELYDPWYTLVSDIQINDYLNSNFHNGTGILCNGCVNVCLENIFIGFKNICLHCTNNIINNHMCDGVQIEQGNFVASLTGVRIDGGSNFIFNNLLHDQISDYCYNLSNLNGLYVSDSYIAILSALQPEENSRVVNASNCINIKFDACSLRGGKPLIAMLAFYDCDNVSITNGDIINATDSIIFNTSDINKTLTVANTQFIDVIGNCLNCSPCNLIYNGNNDNGKVLTGASLEAVNNLFHLNYKTKVNDTNNYIVLDIPFTLAKKPKNITASLSGFTEKYSLSVFDDYTTTNGCRIQILKDTPFTETHIVLNLIIYM